MSIKNDGHYFCRAGGNRPDGLNEPVTIHETMASIFGKILIRKSMLTIVVKCRFAA
nr:copper resistance protein [Escherichia coli]